MDQERNKIISFAHRGANSERPENTMAAFTRAVEAGADFIELDIRRTKNGRAVVIHDATVDRTTDGHGRVSTMSEEQLRELDAGSWFGSRFAGEKIPLLDEVMEWASETDIKLNIEIKDAELEEFAVKRIQEFDMLDRVVLSSWSPKVLLRAREFDPKVQVAPILIYGGALGKTAARLKPSLFLLWGGPAFTRGVATKARNLNIPVITWVVNTAKMRDRVIDRGAAGFITDEISLMTHT